MRKYGFRQNDYHSPPNIKQRNPYEYNISTNCGIFNFLIHLNKWHTTETSNIWQKTSAYVTFSVTICRPGRDNHSRHI
jgi:hypothetical protein